ncbi:unnamed protein product, partial [Urochloa humidicola]
AGLLNARRGFVQVVIAAHACDACRFCRVVPAGSQPPRLQQP